jgi:hypothetical protein
MLAPLQAAKRPVSSYRGPLWFLVLARINAFSDEFMPRPPPFYMLLASLFFASVV